MIQNVYFLTVISFSLQLRDFPNIILIPWRFFILWVWVGWEDEGRVVLFIFGVKNKLRNARAYFRGFTVCTYPDTIHTYIHLTHKQDDQNVFQLNKILKFQLFSIL